MLHSRLQTPLLVAALAFVCATEARSQNIPLNYNFNGIVHSGESMLPDDPNRYRSISDRGLDFTAGVPVNPVLDDYTLVSTEGVLDIVHLGNRNTVDGGNWAFQAIADGDNVGVQPAWLPVVDQTGPQTTTLGAPVLLDTTFSASFVYQISNGGGSFDVTFEFMSGGTFTTTLSAFDWFGGSLPGTDGADNGFVGAANLSVTETTVDLSGSAGEVLTAITFSNSTNANAGVAILGARLDSAPPPPPTTLVPVDLDYNFNGIVHNGEDGNPDDLNGYRSISDRGLDFTAGVPADPTLDDYTLVGAPGVLDIVHLGNRNTTDSGNHAFDAAVDGDDVGVQPTWLTNVDQSGPQTTTLATPVALNAGSFAGVLFQISNGGGNFDVTIRFVGGGSVTATLSGPDWFVAGPPGGGVGFLGTSNQDQGLLGANNLTIIEGIIDLSANAGELVSEIEFSNSSNPVAAVAILAANIAGADGGTDLCNGDGGNQMGCTNCPCGNNAPIGTIGGCINSNAASARIYQSGTSSVSLADLRIEMDGGVPASFAVLTSGDAVAPQNPANPCFGTDSGVQSVVLDGLRCAVQSTQRHGGRPVAADGTVGMGLTNGWGPPNGPMGGLAGQGGFTSGDTRFFQVFYRELPGFVCGTEQNTSQAIGVTFTP